MDHMVTDICCFINCMLSYIVPKMYLQLIVIKFLAGSFFDQNIYI